MKIGELVFLQSNDDVTASLQISRTSIIGCNGERRGKNEVTLLLEDVEGNWQSTSFTEQQLKAFIRKLQKIRKALILSNEALQ